VTLFLTEVVKVTPDQLSLMRSLPSWDARLAADTAAERFVDEIMHFVATT
jgi:hypothetical protein